jgi:hypothetical protein
MEVWALCADLHIQHCKVTGDYMPLKVSRSITGLSSNAPNMLWHPTYNTVSGKAQTPPYHHTAFYLQVQQEFLTGFDTLF